MTLTGGLAVAQRPLAVERIVAAVRGVLNGATAALHEPYFGGNEWLYLKECLDSSFVSSVGKFVDRFEADLASYTGARHAVAVVNGTAALHVALQLAGVGRDDEVLTPTLTSQPRTRSRIAGRCRTSSIARSERSESIRWRSVSTWAVSRKSVATCA